MQPPSDLKHLTASDEANVASTGSVCVLRVVTVYEDLQARTWAIQTSRGVAQMVPEKGIHSTFWSIDELRHPRTLEDAAAEAARADVILVSIQATGDVSPDLCAWLNAWLPRRRPHGGTLIALVRLAGPRIAHSGKAQEYLRASAKKARLDFLLRECVAPNASPGCFEPETGGPNTNKI